MSAAECRSAGSLKRSSTKSSGKRDIRVVLDTNVIVSALSFPISIPRQALDLAFARGVILASSMTLGELARVLARNKIRQYLAADEAAAFLSVFSRRSVSVLVTSETTVARDPDDNAFVNLAIDGRADFLVTGDQDLLVLGTVEETRIVTPAVFIESTRPITPKT